MGENLQYVGFLSIFREFFSTEPWLLEKFIEI